MSNHKWSNWHAWFGGPLSDKPKVIPDNAVYEALLADGDIVNGGGPYCGELSFCDDGSGIGRNVVAYRYRIQENEMHPDLKWLAENVSEWPCAPSENDGRIRVDAAGLYKHGDSAHAVYGSSLAHSRKEIFTQTQWLRARKDLGLIMSDDEESLPAEDWSTTITDTPEEAAMVEDMVNGGFKQLRYQDANGEDWIDEFARTATIDEFRGAMRFTIGKYNRRAGKKDELIKEIEKMRDYCDRWLAYEKERL